MVKTRGSLISIDASGTIADTLTASSWRGRTYTKKHQLPKQPNSGAQTAIKTMMAFLNSQWKNLNPGQRTSWTNFEQNQNLPPYNHYLSANMKRWATFRGIAKTPAWPGVGLNNANTTPTATGGVQHVRVQTFITAVNDGWAIAFCRSKTSGFTATRDNCVAILDATTTGVKFFLDTPLQPGTYFYKWIKLTHEGKLAIAGAEASGTVT